MTAGEGSERAGPGCGGASEALGLEAKFKGTQKSNQDKYHLNAIF